jgi:hypothetical protein
MRTAKKVRSSLRMNLQRSGRIDKGFLKSSTGEQRDVSPPVMGSTGGLTSRRSPVEDKKPIRNASFC